MAFNEEIKSNRLLQSRRFTQDALADFQEAFTRVLDLGASEIYTQTDLIPTSSLPFSGSSQDQAIYSVDGKNILKYWYRQRLTPSDTLNSGETNYNTWFFISGSDYSSVNSGVIQPGQQVNFVSSKYAPSLGTANTEGTPPGYLVRLHNQDSNVIIDPATYTFDYKTGVVQFNEQSGLSVVADIRLTAYQYIGETLEDFILDGGGAGFPFSGSAEITGSLTVSGSGITVNGGAITLITSSITSVSSSINFTTGSITIDNGSITAPSFIGTASWANNALTASKVTVIDDESTNNPYAIVFADPATGDAVQLKSDASTFLYNPSTGLVSIGSDNSYTLIGSGALYTLGSATSPYALLNQANQTVDFGQPNPSPGTNRLNINHSIVNITGNITASVISASSGITGSLFGTASWANNAQTASYVNTLNQDVTINGTLTAYTGSFNVLQVNYISASVIYSSGSNVFGDELTDTQTFTGSVYITGSNFTWNGNTVITTADTASMTVLSASYASTATSADSATSASYALSSSYTLNATNANSATSASYALSSSYALNATSADSATSASYALNATSADSATSASYALNATSASYALNATSADSATSATSASYALNATSASYALNATSADSATSATSASYALNATNATSATSASYALNATSASYALNATSADSATSATSASYALNATNANSATSASYALNATSADSATSASYALNATNANSATSASYALNATSADSATSASYALNATNANSATSASYALNATNATNASTASYVNILNQDVTINGITSTTNLTVTNNATITGDLTVNGETTFINVQNLLVEDKFILLNSGSLTNTPNEGGIIIQTTSSNGVAYGTALYYDQEANRWVVNRSGSVAWNATSSVLSAQSDFIVTVTGSVGAPTGTPVNFGSTNYSYGQMYINTSNSDIYIYA
jgi:hypothetical protein